MKRPVPQVELSEQLQIWRKNTRHPSCSGPSRTNIKISLHVFSFLQLQLILRRGNRRVEKLHEELNSLYSSPNIVRVIKSRRMKWAGHVAHMEEGRVVHKVLVGKPEGKRPLGRPRCRWEDNIKMDLEEVGRGCGDWMELAQDRKRWRSLVSTVMNLRVP